MRRVRRGGFSLVELVLVISLVAVCCALAAPSVTQMMAGYRARAAATRMAVDLYYARMLAVKSGRGATLRFVPDAACPRGAGAQVASRSWVIVLRTEPERQVRSATTVEDGAGACVESNRSDSIAFDSRGLLRAPNNRKLWFTSGSVRDSLSVSVTGRVLRRF
jgi:prepilin-type N-terminal cleavage/methylation domain-containing protein